MSADRMSAVLGLAAVAALAGCGNSAATAPPPPIAVQVSAVSRVTLTSYEVLDGQVDPFLQSSLAPQQSGTLVAVYANEGDSVRKGQVLAKIDDSLLRADLVQQQGVQTQSVAKLSQSKIQLPITDVGARSALVEAQQTVAQTRKQQIADLANVNNTKATYDGDRALLTQGFVSTTTYQQARAAYVAAVQTVASDNDKLAEDEAAVRAAQQNLANTPLQRQVIVENQGSVVQSEGSVEQYRTSIAQTTLTAPFDGRVTARTLDPGGFASPNQAIFQISQIDPVYVDFNLKDTDLAFVREGTRITFVTSARPGRRYAGRVASVNAVPSAGTLLYRARVIEPNPDYTLRGGLEVSVRVAIDVHRDALVVPRAAVVQNGGSGTIYAIVQSDPPGGGAGAAPGGGAGAAQTVAKRMDVRLGLQSGGMVEVAGPGIHAGMPIVLNQLDNLADGAVLAVPSPRPSPERR
jgi:RND family efflux transporter MFP subunit